MIIVFACKDRATCGNIIQDVGGGGGGAIIRRLK